MNIGKAIKSSKKYNFPHSVRKLRLFSRRFENYYSILVREMILDSYNCHPRFARVINSYSCENHLSRTNIEKYSILVTESLILNTVVDIISIIAYKVKHFIFGC